MIQKDEFKALIQKILDDSATKEEKGRVLKELNISLDNLNSFLKKITQAIKDEKAILNIRKNLN
ncbi:MAG: hypothetical protein A3I88_00500 [Candidatus Portnoybacteria bacterium RIFCSPLOWO2_12_FULL_39_9]|uniref:Uncharacterized protein n=1 Tax=Candidatus Portnoybacteria bacterium RIFCSPHIGHO2_12_FULL_38_9 TaxID=1801997 RepID=A0A1G2FIB2_9BACT|nr:MAG: hypothetical protein A3H00_00720 [Candidatus Portnoybacteria bacterium RBG_13_40_8]OGZ36272.1 MAG: hypothetical protein A2646_02130 [Candidatus Portnoybacteria bacterium RIFCSPHIGHO2_02_FULL_39_12]OGZ37318.1 MAG: hypothetical protein A3J64_01595 [Candidatus Portnoybacteria bacterium RIFCSPHIGHO2_12_FULL_38_9]OGZ40931.1 MAG: hypothetical protein A3I88_00500 [Candidatus Portnoybacteria bacterium RIFCSPLOWO2_12_FULL_39_9]